MLYSLHRVVCTALTAQCVVCTVYTAMRVTCTVLIVQYAVCTIMMLQCEMYTVLTFQNNCVLNYFAVCILYCADMFNLVCTKLIYSVYHVFTNRIMCHMHNIHCTIFNVYLIDCVVCNAY